PPLRTEDDRKALVEALRSGLIDCVATDHAPHATHEKEVPFEQAALGTTGLETAFAVLYTRLVLGGELELELTAEHEPGVEDRERRLEPGRTQCRLLEGDFLLVRGVRGMVGRDAVDQSASQRLHQRLAIVLGPQRR